MTHTQELEVIQKVYDFFRWIGPLIGRLPRDKKFTIGDRLLNHWYDILEQLLEAKYSNPDARRRVLRKANIKLEKIRFFHRLLKDENDWSIKRFQYASEKVREIGVSIGGWYKS